MVPRLQNRTQFLIIAGMCYSILLSTTDTRTLSDHNSALVTFDRNLSQQDLEFVPLLRYLHRWSVGSKSGCACTFRHLHAIELGFAAPQDWYPEENDEIEATREFFDVVSGLTAAGSRVDCICWWSGAIPGEIATLEVDLATVRRDAFRFFENYHFELVNTPAQFRAD